MEGPPFGWESNSLAKSREPRTGPGHASTYRTQLRKTTTSTRQNTAHSPGQELRSRPSSNFASYYKSGFQRSQNYNSPNTVVIYDHTLTARRVALPPYFVTPLVTLPRYDFYDSWRQCGSQEQLIIAYIEEANIL